MSKIELFWKALTCWHVPISSRGSLERADVVVTHEFGDQHTLSGTTREMVLLAIQLREKYNIPWIAQTPGNQEAQIPPVAVIVRNESKVGAYLDTEEVNRQVAEICRGYGWERVILITHPHHAWRAGKNLERHGLRVYFPNLESVKYDPHNPRFLLSSPWTFVPREILARLLYLVRGYV